MTTLASVRVKRALRKLHIHFYIVTIHTAKGKRKAFRLSTATTLCLTNLHLIQPN